MEVTFKNTSAGNDKKSPSKTPEIVKDNMTITKAKFKKVRVDIEMSDQAIVAL